jgi:hypothetical protein
MTESPERFILARPGQPTLCEALAKAIREYHEGNDPRAATRSSLLKLALTSIELHKKAIANNVAPWPDGKGPISVALACLKTVRKNEGVLND